MGRILDAIKVWLFEDLNPAPAIVLPPPALVQALSVPQHEQLAAHIVELNQQVGALQRRVAELTHEKRLSWSYLAAIARRNPHNVLLFRDDEIRMITNDTALTPEQPGEGWIALTLNEPWLVN